MADSAKRISDGSFTNTIKMTLTTEGHLGVGNIDPKFTITSAGLVQGRSSISIVPLVAGVGLTGKGFNVGLDAWNGDVHTQIGQVTSDGSNNGCIQVSAGGGLNGTSFGGTAYGLSLQPSGGNVGIGMTQATSRLQVNGTIRTDVDFVTNTDTPGWFPLAVNNANMVGQEDTNGNAIWKVNDLTSVRNVKYKILGKTVHISGIVQNVVPRDSNGNAIPNVPFGPTNPRPKGWGWIIPSFLTPKTDRVISTISYSDAWGSGYMYQGNSGNLNTFGAPEQSTITYIVNTVNQGSHWHDGNGAVYNGWILQINKYPSVNGWAFFHESNGANFRFSITYELA